MGSSAPLGTKSLFNTPGASLPGYVREIARELMKKGKTKSEAVQMAIGICKRWAAEGKPKAVAAIAEWEAAKAKAHATPNKSDLSNPVYAPGRVVLLATPPKEKPKKAEKRKEEGKLPPGATGWKHGWIPVDSSGKAVGPSQKPAWLKDAEAKHKAAGGRDADAIQAEKAKAEFKARADKAARPAKEAAAKAKREKAEREREAKKKTADLKRKTAETERAKKAEDRKAEQKKRERDALVNKAYKQALADRKAGRELSEQQRRVVAHVEAQQKKDANKLRGVDVPGADGSKVAAKAPAKKTAAKKTAAKTAAKKASAVAKGAATTATKKAPPVKVRSYTSGLQNRNKSRRQGAVTHLSNPYAPWDEGGGVNGSFVLDLANLPKGQLAFRYKHGWILINPAIPSRGRMGGGIARKHGHKSGTVTHGHFEPGAGGKGKKFVPTRSGGVNNPAKLKAAHSKNITGAPADQKKYGLVAAQKDSGNALKPSVPSAEKVSSVSKDANAASVQANKSKSLADAQVAAKKHADAFVQAKKAGNAQLAESHKSNAQAWAKKAQQIKQAEKASADAKKKYEADQKAKAADDLAKAQAAEAEKKLKVQQETLDKVKAAHDLQKLAEGMPENNVPALKAKAQQYKYAADKYGEAADHLKKGGQPESPSLEKNKKAAEENAAKYAKAATEKKEKIQKAQALATDAYDLSDDASESQTAEDFQIAAHAHQKAGKAFQELGMTTEHTMHFDKASQLMKKHHEAKALEDKFLNQAKAKAETKPDLPPGIAKSNENSAAADAISKTLDDLPETASGSLAAWDDFLHASLAAKKNPSADNLNKLVAAQKNLKSQGVTDLEMKDANANLYHKAGLMGAKKKTVAQKKAAQATPPAKKVAAAPPGMSPAEKKEAYVDAYKGFLEDGDVAKANELKAKAIAKGFASDSDFPAAPASTPAPAVPVPTISLPGPGMYADGNAIVKGKKKADEMPEGPAKDAQLTAVSNAMKEFEKKHGKKFDITAVEVMSTSTFVPTPSDLNEHPAYADAIQAGYKPVNPEDSANGSWKPSQVPGLKSKAGGYHYSGGAYTDINTQLRKYKSPTGGNNDAAIAQMDKEFAAVPPLTQGIVTTRRMGDKGPFPEIPPPMEPGVVYQDHGYSSTSKDPGVWSGSVVMQVRIPPGARVLDLNHTTGSQHANEKEILLNRGSKYRVVSDEQKAGERRIIVELVV